MLQSIFYFLITLGLEVLPPSKLTPVTIDFCWRKLKTLCRASNNSVLEPLLASSSDTLALELDEDIDVKAERNRVHSGAADRAIIYLRDLRKVSFFFCFILCFMMLL